MHGNLTIPIVSVMPFETRITQSQGYLHRTPFVDLHAHSSLGVRRYRKPSCHEIQMLLIHAVLVRKQTLDIIVCTKLPSLVSFCLLHKDFRGQCRRILILDDAFGL